METQEKESVEQKVDQNQQQTIETDTAETQQQIDWRRFREAREKDRKQKEAAEKLAQQKAAEAEALKQAMDALLSKPTLGSNNLPEANLDEEESEEQRIEKKIQNILAERERKQEEERRKKEQQELPQRLNQTFNDFDKICTEENLDYLEYHYPEVATPYKHMPDNYDKWAAIYKAVKRFVPNPDSKKDEKKAEKNLSKPQSISVPGMTSVGDSAPIKLDDKRRADNWARMQRTMKGL